MSCTLDERARVYREEMLEAHRDLAEARARLASLESSDRVAARLAEQFHRLSPLADGSERLDDVLIGLVDAAVDSIVRDWHEKAPHAVAARRIRTELKLRIRALFDDEEGP